MTRKALLGAAVALAILAAPAAAHARAVEFLVGGGGGYEWFDLRALSYDDLLSVDAVDASGNPVTYKPDLAKYRGSYFAFDVYAGIKLLAFGLMVDYRGAYTDRDISFNQLMLDLTFFIPTKKVVPFIRVGVGYVWSRVRVDEDTLDLSETISPRGLGARVGAGLDIRLVKFLSFGVGSDVGFIYFKSGSGRSFGMMVDVLARITFHV
jgi:opacity protein-like surface antigen